MVSRLIKNFTPYLISLLILLFIFFFILQGYNFRLTIPLVYVGDGLFSTSYIKTIIDTGWTLTNPYLSYPGTFQLYDYPGLDNFNALLQHVISLWSRSPFVVINIFYLLTYILSAFSSLYVYRRLGLPRAFAIVSSVLFAILPYHFWRNEGHLYLSSYFAVPLWLMLAFSIMNKEGFFSFQNKYWNGIALFILLLVIVNTGVYYTFFGLFYVFIAGVMQGSSKPFLRSLTIILLSAFITIANLAPNIAFTHEYGKNNAVGHRGFDESEILGLEIPQLLLPIDGHRLPSFAHVRERYDKETAQIATKLINENTAASLGILGSLGFLASLAVIFLQRARKPMNAVYHAALFNLAGLLFATICGFGTFFAMFITPNIRAYNRISVFLGFLSLFIFFKCIQYLGEKYHLKSKTMGIIACIFLAIGILDQISPFYSFPKISPNQDAFQNDQTFVATIEKILPPGSAVFELPYVPFPENPPVNNMTDYEQFRPYLHSTTLRWSYGAMKGRPIATWQQNTANLPLPEMLNTLVSSGFSGIYIDRNGYTDNAKSLETSLIALLHESPLISPNGQMSFFSLLHYKVQSQQIREPFFDKT